MSNRVLALAVVLILLSGGLADSNSIGESVDKPYDETVGSIDAITTTGRIVSFDKESARMVVETSDGLLTLDDLSEFEPLFDDFKVGAKVSLTYEWIEGDVMLVDIKVVDE